MTLTGKQKRQLKARGQTMSDDVRLGKEGLSAGFVARVEALLAQKELVKLRFTELEGDSRKDLAAEVCAATGADCVAVLGKTMLLYKPNPELDPAKRALRE